MGVVNTVYCWFLDVLSFFVKLIPITNSAEVVDMSSAKAQEVKDLIKSDTVVIFSKTYCPYCKMAKEVIIYCIKLFTL